MSANTIIDFSALVAAQYFVLYHVPLSKNSVAEEHEAREIISKTAKQIQEHDPMLLSMDLAAFAQMTAEDDLALAEFMLDFFSVNMNIKIKALSEHLH